MSDMETNDELRSKSTKILQVEQQIEIHQRNRKKGEGFRNTIFSDPLEIVTSAAQFEPGVDRKWHPPMYEKTPDQEVFLMNALFIEDNFLFMDLTPGEKQMFLNAMQPEVVHDGHIVIKQGDRANTGSDFYFYIVEEGKINFVDEGVLDNSGGAKENPVVLGSCSRGGSFGELALLYNCPRAVSCIAASPVVKLWKVDQITFRYLMARNAAEQRHCIREWVRKVKIFEHLDDAAVSRFINAMTLVHWKEGDLIVRKGDVGNVFYMIQDGRAKCHDIGLGDSKIEDQVLGPGQWFGERALLTGERRAANVTALSDITTLAMDRETFEECVGPLQNFLEKEMRKTFLRSLPLFCRPATDEEGGTGGVRSLVTDQQLDHLASFMQETSYKKGEKLAVMGKPYDMKLWIIRHGELLVREVQATGEDKVYSLKSGDYFGDQSIRCDPSTPSRHDVCCQEDVGTWVLGREQLESIVGNLDSPNSMIARGLKRMEGGLQVSDEDPESGDDTAYVTVYDKSITMADLHKHKVLGVGSFGKVWLVSHKDKGSAYALKTMSKVKLLETRQYEGVMREKDLLAQLRHPFILDMVSCFQDDRNLYLLLPMVPGGELFSVLHRQKSPGRGLPDKNAAFYAACVIEAIGHFHQNHIAYRDLKLENVLIDEHGYCKVVDLGFAKIVTDKTYTLVGTPEYLAPEIIINKGYDKAVDYWSFGVLVFELLMGFSPFFTRGTTQIDMFKRIVLVRYSFPDFVDDGAKHMIKKLLVRNPAKRLGNLSQGYLAVKKHPYFLRYGIDFRKLNKLTAVAPWKPAVKNPLDSSNFDDYSAEERKVVNERLLSQKEQDIFKKF